MIKYVSRLDPNVEIFLDIDLNKKYGILLSGGLDSAVLMYLLIKTNKDINLQPFTIPKYDGAFLYADPVIDHFNKKFNLSIPKTIKVGDPNVFHRKQSETAVRDIKEKYPVDFLFIALNQNPPELNELDGAPKRSTHSPDPSIILPFVNLLKTHIIDFMIEYGQEDLSLITHSCTEQQTGRCGRCWQCTERQWAFDQLKILDQGIK